MFSKLKKWLDLSVIFKEISSQEKAENVCLSKLSLNGFPGENSCDLLTNSDRGRM